MATPSGEEVALTLLRALPSDVAEAIIGRIGGSAGEQLRARLQAASGPPPNEELDSALQAFFDLQRISERTLPAVSSESSAGEYRPGVPSSANAKKSKPAAGLEDPDDEEETLDDMPKDPMRALRGLPADKLARALEGEPAPAIALVLGSLEPAVSGAVLKQLPEEVRGEVGLRLIQPSPRNHALLEQLARAVAEKGRKLKRLPQQPSEEERILRLADVMRAMPRADRIPVLQKLESVDQELGTKVRERMYRFEDLLRVQDRPLQGLLTELDVKTIATALKGVEEKIKTKVTSNMSARSREVLNEEMELLGSVPAMRVKEKQSEVLAILRKLEEEGKITIED